jgi:hypothetical protein
MHRAIASALDSRPLAEQKQSLANLLEAVGFVFFFTA